MSKPKFPYAGDANLKRLLERYRCPLPFHVVRMRFWGEIVSPSLRASPIKTIESFWPNGLPAFGDAAQANAFFQALMGLWNTVIANWFFTACPSWPSSAWPASLGA